MTNQNIDERRLCVVNDRRFGYFHMWEQYSEPVEASPLIGGPPAGVFSKVYAIVEFPTGVERIDPRCIQFIDEKNKMLSAYEKTLQWTESRPMK